jgi:hypothetical protein
MKKPEKREDSGTRRQKRIQREQHRPEQNAGYDEAVRRGGSNSPMATDKTETMPPLPAEEQKARDIEEIDNREARAAAADVRRQDRSAD